MPIDTPTLSLLPSYPSLAVSNTTASKTRAPLRWLPSSTRRRSPTSSEPPPPKCLLSCQRPLTRLLSHRFPSCPLLAVSGATTSEPRAPLRSLPSSRRRRLPPSSAPPPQSVCFRVSALDTRLLSPFPSCPSLPGSEATGLETKPKRRSKTLRAAASASAFSKRPRCATPEFGGGGCRRLAPVGARWAGRGVVPPARHVAFVVWRFCGVSNFLALACERAGLCHHSLPST